MPSHLNKKNYLKCDILENRNLLATCPGTNGETTTTPTLTFLDGTTTAALTCALGGDGWAASLGDPVVMTTIPVLHSTGNGQYQIGFKVEISTDADDDKCVFPEALTKPTDIPTGYCLLPENCAVEAELSADASLLSAMIFSADTPAVAAAGEFKITVKIPTTPVLTVRWGDCTNTCTQSSLKINSFVHMESADPNFITLTAQPTGFTPSATTFRLNDGNIAEIANPCRDFDCMAEADQKQVLAELGTMAPFNR